MKILMLMMEIGSGHKMPAISVKEALLKKYPSAEVKIIDVGRELGSEKVYNFYKKTWYFLLKHPPVYDIAYKLSNNRLVNLNYLESIAFAELKKKLLKFIKEEKPDVIFSTHFTGANLVSYLKKEGKLDIPDALLITDAFIAHPLWTAGHNDHYILYDKNVFPAIEKRGIKKEQLVQMSMPLRKEFTTKKGCNQKKLRKKLGLDTDDLIVTLVSGGEGVGDIEKQVRAYLKAGLKITLVVICGRNKNLYTRLNVLSAKNKNSSMQVISLGFVNNMHEYLAATDIIIGKSGISFTLEGLFFNRPFIVTQTMANEAGARDFVVKHKLGWFAPKIPQQVRILRKLSADRSILDKYVKRCKELNIRNGSLEIADYLVGLIKKK